MGRAWASTARRRTASPSTRPPCAFLSSSPGRIEAGLRPTGRASLVDLFPTICEALDLGVPPGVEGGSLLAALRGSDREERPVYLETLVPRLHYGWAPLLGWMAGRWKYV